MRAAVIKNGIVVNIIKVKSLDGHIEAKEARIGDTWDGTAFNETPKTPEDEAKEAKQLAKEERKAALKNKTKDKAWSALTKAEKDAILEHYAIASGLI